MKMIAMALRQCNLLHLEPEPEDAFTKIDDGITHNLYSCVCAGLTYRIAPGGLRLRKKP